MEQRVLNLSKKWWFYIILICLFFLPFITTLPYDSRDSSIYVKLVGQILYAPLIESYPIVFVITKVIMIALLALVFIYGKKFTRIFSAYVAVLYVVIALFQNSNPNTQYGFGIITGNVVLMLIVAIVWMWEVVANKTDYSQIKQNIVKNWWVIALAIIAFWWPLNRAAGQFEISPLLFLTSEAMVSFCMLTPVVLSMMILAYPKVNTLTLRFTSFIGILFGLINAVMWFGFAGNLWVGGVLHFPLLILSVYGFYLSKKKRDK